MSVAAQKYCYLVFAYLSGVHRGAETTMDISADLTELSNTPVTVVSSGVKSILDIPKTLEVLETLGVPVCGYKTKEFPGFFTNVTGCPSPLVIDSAMDAALMMYHSVQLGLKNGMLVAVPNPTPTSEGGVNDAEMARIIEDAVAGAAVKGIEGAAITPYLLSKVAELTGGSSVNSNVALVYNNAKVATMIASDYSKLIIGNSLSSPSVDAFTSFPSVHRKSKRPKFKVAVVGGMVIDHVVRPVCSQGSTTPPPLIMRTSNPGVASQSFGGVGRNIAEAVSMAVGEERPDVAVHMVSTVGNDAYGSSLLEHTAGLGIDVSCVIRDTEHSDFSQRTATYTAVHDHSGDLLVAVADMDIFKNLSENIVKSSFSKIFGTSGGQLGQDFVVCDGNISPETLRFVASFCSDSKALLFYEPTSVPKCTIPVKAGCLQQVRRLLSCSAAFTFLNVCLFPYQVDVIKPNVDELRELVRACRNDRMYGNAGCGDTISNQVDSILLTPSDKVLSMEDVTVLASALSCHMTCAAPKRHDILVSMGADGILWYMKEADEKSAVELVAVPEIENPDGRSLITNGAGDAFSGGFVKGLCDDINTSSTRELYRHAIMCGIETARTRILSTSGL